MEAFRLNKGLIKSLGNVLFMSAAEMMGAASIPITTWYKIMKQPETITLQQLLAIANGLHIPVRRFFSTGKADIIGRREDYVTDAYKECRYDSDALREIVNTRTDATWQKAADATGMTPIRLRDSLLAVTRTPVERFLKVCDVFAVDPFAILTDPNPEQKRKAGRRGSDTLATEVDALKESNRILFETIAELKSRYEEICDKYDRLMDMHRVFIEQYGAEISSRAIMAAEP